MEDSSIIGFYHFFFIGIAGLVALLAFGAATRYGIFKEMSEPHRHALVVTFLVGAATAVVTNYQALPKLKVKQAEHYSFSLDYYDSYPDHKAAFEHGRIDFKTCRENSDKENGATNKNHGSQVTAGNKCEAVIKTITETRNALSSRGHGEMFLAIAPNGSLYEGLVSFNIPNATQPLSMKVDGTKINDDHIHLNFIQQGRIVVTYTEEQISEVDSGNRDKKNGKKKAASKKESGNPKPIKDPLFKKTYNERNVFTFEIDFIRDKVNPEILKGVLYHPVETIDCDMLDEELYETKLKQYYPDIFASYCISSQGTDKKVCEGVKTKKTSQLNCSVDPKLVTNERPLCPAGFLFVDYPPLKRIDESLKILGNSVDKCRIPLAKSTLVATY